MCKILEVYSRCTFPTNHKTEQQNTEEEGSAARNTEITEDTSSPTVVLEEERGEESTESRSENESLLEWIDRQLKEAEERKRLREQ